MDATVSAVFLVLKRGDTLGTNSLTGNDLATTISTFLAASHYPTCPVALVI